MKLERTHKILVVIIAVPAALAALGGLYGGMRGTVKGWAQEASRAAVKEDQAAVVEQLQGLNANVRILIDQNAYQACLSVGPAQIPGPATWSELSEAQRRTVCDRERRYRQAVWSHEDCEKAKGAGKCGPPPKPEEVP